MSINDSAGAFGKPAIVLLMMLSMNGCTAASHPSSPASHGIPLPTTTVSQNATTERSNAVAAYTGMWNDMVNAADTANWQDPALTHHATGEAIAEMVSGLYSMKQKGLVTQGAPVLHPHVTDSTDSTADISDCVSTVSWLAHIATTGKLQDNVPGGNRLIKAHVELADGTWRVTYYSTGELGSC